MDKKINTDIMPRIGHLDSVNQNLVEKLLGFQTDFDGKLKKQEQMDDSLLNKINELQLNNNDNVSSLQNQLANLDFDNKNNIQQIFTLQESINIQSEQVKKVDAERQKEANKTKEDIESTIASNAKAISDLRNELANSIADKFKPTEDKINNIDNSLQDVNKTLAIFDVRHVETVEKMKEMTVITNNIQVQIKAQEQKMIEQSANDLNQIRDQLRDIENQAGLSGQKIQELDRDSQTLQEKVLGMESQVADRLDDLVKSDASILAKINGLESNTTQNINQLTINLEKKMADTENKIHLEIESVNKQTEDLTNNLEEQLGNIEDVMDKKINTDIMPRIGHLDNTISDMEKDIKPSVASNTKAISDFRNQITESISDKLKPTEDKINNIKSSLQTRMDTLDGDNKANTLQIVNIQESINIQAEHVKKVVAERQLNEAKAKEDLEAAVAGNERAIAELRNEIDNSIVEKFKPTEEKLNGIDGQVQILNKSVTVFESRHVETVEKFKEVNVITNTIQTQMKEQEQKMVEQSANDLIKIREQLVNLENITTVSNQEIDAVKKQTDNLAGHVENQLANMEDAMDKKINTDIMPRIGHLDSVNQNLVEKLLGFQTDFDGKLKKQEQIDDSLLNKINELQLNNNDNVSSLQNQLANLDSDNKNNIQQIFTLQESINIQSEQVKKVDAERQKEANKTKEDIESTIASNAKAISDLRNELANSIADKFKPTEDKINNIDNSLQDVNKTLAIFDGRHVETVEKMKEMTVITNNIQVQIKAQEQKMIEQSANDLNQIRDQLRDIENQAGLSGQKIQELDRDSQ